MTYSISKSSGFRMSTVPPSAVGNDNISALIKQTLHIVNRFLYYIHTM